MPVNIPSNQAGRLASSPSNPSNDDNHPIAERAALSVRDGADHRLSGLSHRRSHDSAHDLDTPALRRQTLTSQSGAERNSSPSGASAAAITGPTAQPKLSAWRGNAISASTVSIPTPRSLGAQAGRRQPFFDASERPVSRQFQGSLDDLHGARPEQVFSATLPIHENWSRSNLFDNNRHDQDRQWVRGRLLEYRRDSTGTLPKSSEKEQKRAQKNKDVIGRFVNYVQPRYWFSPQDNESGVAM